MPYCMLSAVSSRRIVCEVPYCLQEVGGEVLVYTEVSPLLKGAPHRGILRPMVSWILLRNLISSYLHSCLQGSAQGAAPELEHFDCG